MDINILKERKIIHIQLLYFSIIKKLTNYLEGVRLDKKSFDLNIMNLKEKKSVKEKIITYCYYFDPDNQTYSMLIFKILRILCLITVLIISILIFLFAI